MVVGSASEIADLADDGLPVDFVACNISSPDLMDTELLSDILDLKDRGIAVIAFCDRWTLARLQPLKNNGFLPFDWDDCRFLDNKQGLHLSSIQNRMLTRQHEKVLPVSDEDSGLARAKQILYDDLRISDIDDDDVLAAIQDLFGVLGSAIRMTEAPDEAYSNRQRELIDDSLDTIRSSMILSSQEFGEITVVCDILSKFFEPGRLAPDCRHRILSVCRRTIRQGCRAAVAVLRCLCILPSSPCRPSTDTLGGESWLRRP